MAYVLTNSTNTAVVEYPYNIGLLRRDNPNVSFPASPTNAQLAEWNVYPVTDTTAPSYHVINENLTELDPIKVDISWVQQWQVDAASAGEIAERTASYEAISNAEAARLLAETDKYWIEAFESGTSLHVDFLNYRAALSDPATLSGYPAYTVYPTFPTNIFDNKDNLPIPVYTKDEADDKFIDQVELDAALGNYATLATVGDYVGQFNDAIALKADTTYVDTTFVPQAGFTDAVLTAAGGSFLPFSGGVMTGEIDMGFNSIVGLADPQWPQDAAHKQYVDNLFSTAAILPKLTINLQTDAGNITTAPKIADALATIGTTNGYTINLGFGEYRETGPIVFDGKWQLNVVGVHSANTTAATIKNGVTIQNSNGVRFFKVQVEGASSIACRAGLGQQFESTQFMGNLTLSGTGGFMMFKDCEFGGNVTVDAAFAGVIYFIRCSFSNASGVYSFNQTSALQVIITDSSGLPNTQPAKVSYAGTILSKNNVQKFYINNVAINPVGATNGQVLQLVSGTSNEWVPRTLTSANWTVITNHTTSGAKTLSTTWTAFKAAYKEFFIVGIGSDGHVSTAFYPTTLINNGRSFEIYHARGNRYLTVNGITDINTNAYTLTMDAGFTEFWIYARN